MDLARLDRMYDAWVSSKIGYKLGLIAPGTRVIIQEADLEKPKVVLAVITDPNGNPIQAAKTLSMTMEFLDLKEEDREALAENIARLVKEKNLREQREGELNNRPIPVTAGSR